MLFVWRVSPSIGAFGPLNKKKSGGCRPPSELLVLLTNIDFLEVFALNRSLWSSKRERACFSEGFRPHLEILVLMDMSKFRPLHVQVPTFGSISHLSGLKISCWNNTDVLILYMNTVKLRGSGTEKHGFSDFLNLESIFLIWVFTVHDFIFLGCHHEQRATVLHPSAVRRPWEWDKRAAHGWHYTAFCHHQYSLCTWHLLRPCMQAKPPLFRGVPSL